MPGLAFTDQPVRWKGCTPRAQVHASRQDADGPPRGNSGRLAKQHLQSMWSATPREGRLLVGRIADIPVSSSRSRAGGGRIELDMDKGRHPKVVRTWVLGKSRKPVLPRQAAPALERKPQPHNKT